MARRALHECQAPGCHELVTATYCPAHTRAPVRRPDAARPSARQRGYDTHWEKLRKVILGRGPLCETCTSEGRRGVPATVVHHRDHNPRNNREDNLQPLCRECHERHHGRQRARWDESLRAEGAL